MAKYKVTEETKRKISSGNKGKHNSPNTEFKKKHKCFNTGRTWFKKGQKLSEEHKQKISLNHRHYQSEETKKKISKSLKGKKLTEETKRKISLTNKGKNLNEKNWNWKGDRAGKVAFHNWLRKNKPKSNFCEECKKNKKLTLANIKNHQYTRNPDDYKWLCYSCHLKFDCSIRKIQSFTFSNCNNRKIQN